MENKRENTVLVMHYTRKKKQELFMVAMFVNGSGQNLELVIYIKQKIIAKKPLSVVTDDDTTHVAVDEPEM